MDPKWNPIALMVLGTGLTLVAFFSSASYPLTAVIIGLVVGALTLASGVVLAYIQTIRY